MAPAQDVEKASGWKDTQSRVGAYSTAMRICIVMALAFAQFLSFFDQTSVNTAVPTIAASLNVGSSISWVATSFLASSTAMQLIIGRLSDIFGRKTTMVGALGLLLLGELLNGFAKNDIWLYACRAIAGFGAGSLGSQMQIVITDITTMEQRGKYFGITGTAIALGNGLGPVIGGLLTEHVGWRWVFWVVPPMCAVCIIVVILIVPGSGQAENIPARLKMMDWFGVVMTLAGTYLVLIPISQGGVSFAYNSAAFIVLLIIGLLILIVTFIVEAKFVKLPVIAVYLFKQGYEVNVFLWQNFAIGWVYFGNLFFTPQYLQNVLGNSPARAGVLLLPLVVTHGVSSALTGTAVSWSKRYMWALRTGYCLWTIGLACQAAFFRRNTSVLAIAFIGVVQGIGVGFCLQNNMVGILAHTYKRDRAVATGLRSFIRGVAGSIGIAVCNAIIKNTLSSGLQGIVPEDLIGQVSSSTVDLGRLGLDTAQQEAVRDAYMKGTFIVFVTYAPMMAMALIAMIPIKDQGMKQMDDRKVEASDDASKIEPQAEQGIAEQRSASTGKELGHAATATDEIERIEPVTARKETELAVGKASS